LIHWRCGGDNLDEVGTIQGILLGVVIGIAVGIGVYTFAYARG
jgi:hypothetical protein